MQKYDVTLKQLLHGQASRLLRELTGSTVGKWLSVELPKVQDLRLDLLGETIEGDLFHLELQSTNDAAMPLRMAEYSLGVYRLLGQFPRQVLLYVGQAPLRMDNELRGPDAWFRYRLIDIRSLDGDSLLESEEIGDNVIAILAHLRDHKEAVRMVSRRIAGLAAGARETALGQLRILAELRHLAGAVEEETRTMPIEIDMLESEFLGPAFRRGLAEGRQEGRQEGDLAIITRLIERRFGALPSWAGEKLAALSTSELEDLSERVLDAPTLEDLLK